MRWFKRIAFFLLMLVMALSLGLWAVMKHSSLSPWAVSKLVQQLPWVSVEQISGSLWDGLAVSNLVIKQEAYTLIIEDGFIRWRWQDWWQSDTLSVAELSLGRVAVDLPYLKPQEEKSKLDWRQLELPDMVVPITLQLSQLKLHQLSIYLANSEAIELSDLALSLNIKNNRLHLNQLSASVQMPVSAQIVLSGQLGLIAPHGVNLGIEVEMMQPEWGDGQASIMIAGDAQQIALRVESNGNVQPLGAVLAKGDVWLSREQASSPEFVLVTPHGQLSVYDVQADWHSALSVKAIARLDADRNSVQVSGAFLPQPDVSLIIDANNLATFKSLADLSGTIQGKAKVFGSWQAPQGELALQGKSLSWQQHGLASLTLNAKGDSAQLAAQLGAQGFSNAGKNSRLEATWQGSLAQHQLSISAKALDTSLTSRWRGGFNKENQWLGILDDVQLIHTDGGLWQQQGRSRLLASAESVNLLTDLCLQQLSSSVCINSASWSARQGIKLNAAVKDIYLTRLSRWLPSTLSMAGKAQATLNFSQHANQRQAQLAIQLPANRISYQTETGAITFDYQQLSLAVQLDNEQINSQLTADFKQGIRLKARGIHNLNQLDALNVNAQLTVDQLGFLQPLIPDINALSGSVSADMALLGSLSKPQLNAQVQVSSLQFVPIMTGVEFRVPTLLLDIKPTGLVRIDGQLLAGEGQASLKGWGNLSDFSRWSLDLLIEGRSLQIAKTVQADIWLSPNIQLSATPQQVDILGQLIVPKARLRAKSVGRNAIGLSDDVVLVGEESSASAMKLIPHMRVILGEDVQVEGSGLSAVLTGQLDITRSRLGQLLFQGEVNTLNGQFKAYQQDLRIEQGKLIFNGVSDNPGLNIIASRKLLDETVGVKVTGSLAAPKLTVFSRPVMPDTDALSLLVLGKRARDMTATDAALLATKLATESDEDPLLQRLGQEAGLDVGLTNIKGEKNTGLSLGKRLTPDLYVRYVVGAFEYGARFITEYRINRLFSVEVQAGQYPSGDVFYRFEGD